MLITRHQNAGKIITYRYLTHHSNPSKFDEVEIFGKKASNQTELMNKLRTDEMKGKCSTNQFKSFVPSGI
jgi:hypothetical protein